MSRIFLSPPDLGPAERELLLEAIDSNWIAPLGPHVDAFEREIAEVIGARHAVALSSGTAALHLALLVAGVGPGDEVLLPTMTFVATANPVAYVGARPVFIDCSRLTWNIDPDLVEEELQRRHETGNQVAAVITVDLYGQCAPHDPIRTACDRFGIPLIEDAAEALGASYRGRAAGTLGHSAVFSFNGNKIITTSGGGMFVTDNARWAEEVRHLSTQARDPALHYEHSVTGFNYRLSNLLAAVGRGQLRSLHEKVARRRQTNAWYRARFGGMPGIDFMPHDPEGAPTWWLTAIAIDPDRFGATRDEIIAAMERADIECRPTWKPMHLQPLFKKAQIVRGEAAETVFSSGLCLPSGSSLQERDLDRIADVLVSCRR